MLVNTILKQTHKLQVFHYQWWTIFSQHPTDLVSIKTAPDIVRGTLKCLIFELQPSQLSMQTDSIKYQNRLAAIKGKLGSFKEYKALTHFKLSLHTLFESEDCSLDSFHDVAAILPRNMEHLTIRTDLYMFNKSQICCEELRGMSIICHWLDGDGPNSLRNTSARLKSFVLDLRSARRLSKFWQDPTSRDGVLQICEKKGIEGQVLWWEYDGAELSAGKAEGEIVVEP